MTKEEIIQGLYRGDSRAIKEAIKALEQHTSEDCVSRAELEKWLDLNFSFGGACRKLELFDRLEKELPRVTPKLPTSDDCVSRQATLDAIIKELCIKDESYLLPSEKAIYNVVKDMPPVTPTIPSSEDCVRKAEVNKLYDEYRPKLATHVSEFGDKLKALPPVTPTRKSGLRWIERFDNEDKWLECPHCHKDSDNAYAYCPNCGASFKEEKRGNGND